MSQRVVKENDNEEIESIEGPAKKSGKESVAGAGFFGIRRLDCRAARL